MGAGLTVYNDDGIYQIDETTINLSLISRGTASTFATHGSGAVYVDIVVTAESPIFAFRAPAANLIVAALSGVSKSGSTWTFRLVVADRDPAAVRQLDWFVYDRPVVAASFGLEVYDSTGALRFSSALKPMRVIGYGESSYSAPSPIAVVGFAIYRSLNYEVEFSSGPEGTAYYFTNYMTGYYEGGQEEVVIGSGEGVASTYQETLGGGTVDLGGIILLDVTGH
jgi:hypothetical protein